MHGEKRLCLGETVSVVLFSGVYTIVGIFLTSIRSPLLFLSFNRVIILNDRAAAVNRVVGLGSPAQRNLTVVRLSDRLLVIYY